MLTRINKLMLVIGVAALGLVLAGGLLLGSNMGFKLERNYKYFAGNANLYFLSLPFFSEYSTDSGVDMNNDTFINCDDLLFDYAGRPTDNAINRLTLLRYLPDQLEWQNRDAAPHPVGPPAFPPILFSGDPAWDVEKSVGYQLKVVDNLGPSGNENPVVIVGSHDPEFAGLVLGVGKSYQVSIPYHTTWETIEDLLVGTFVTGVGKEDVARGEAVSFLNYNYETQESRNEYFNVSIAPHPVGPPTFPAYLLSGDTTPGNGPSENPTFNITPGDGYFLIYRQLASNPPAEIRYLSPHY